MHRRRELEVAIEAVLRACRLCERVQATLVTGESIAKRDRSPVTVADYGAQAVVAAALRDVFPDIPMVGEEDASALRQPGRESLRDRVIERARAELPADVSDDDILALIDHGTHAGGAEGRHWTLDPIDGTKGFLRGEQYAVALALIEDGAVTLGVLGCPNLPVAADQPDGARGVLLYAARGRGTYLRPLAGGEARQISVTEIDDASAANFCESVESSHSSQDDAAAVAARLGITRPPYRIDSQCKYAAVSRGDASIYLRLPTGKDYVEKIWDHAAGSIVVEEAGGRVTDIHGRALDFSRGRLLTENSGVIVTNGRLHARVLEAVGAVLGLA